jgi:hypothetical protein
MAREGDEYTVDEAARVLGLSCRASEAYSPKVGEG